MIRRILAAVVFALTVLVLLPTAGLANPPSVRPAAAVVVDANGKQVGNVVGVDGAGSRATVAVTVNGEGVLLFFDRADATSSVPLGTILPLHGSSNVFYFQSTDCSGTLLISTRGNTLVPPSFVGPLGMTVYLPVDPLAVPAAVPVGSFIRDGRDGPLIVIRDGVPVIIPSGVCQVEVPVPGASFPLVIPGKPVFDFSTAFTLPFAIEVRR